VNVTRSIARRNVRRSLAVLAGFGLVAGAVTTAASTAQATPPRPAHAKKAAYDGYYDDAKGKTGKELKKALHTIISRDAKKLSYDQVLDALKETDKDPKNDKNVIELYTGKSVSADSREWNREHVWAKSHGDFGTKEGPGTDVHHLRPADMKVNSTRGNKDFDNGGDEVEGAPGNRTDDDSFEPRDAVKGDVARMILYMAVRYEGDDSFPDLEPNDKVDNGSAPNMGRLSVLKKWNEQDPPDDFEKNRNQVIFDKFQHNRNPFVDHPEWVKSIWS